MDKKIFFWGGVFFFFLFFVFISPASAQLVSSLDDYCVDSSGNALGYYIADDGKKCGRAPYCAGKSYEEVEQMISDFRIVNECWDHRCGWGMCEGEVPLCCYEVERTGNPMYCTWPERGYCHATQCAKIDRSKQYQCGTSAGDDCNCGDPLIGWCVDRDHCVANANDIPYIPISSRVGTIPSPTPTNSPTPTGQPCLPQKKAGDYDCSGTVNLADFDAWKTDFLQNKTTLSFFEYWRRVAFSQ